MQDAVLAAFLITDDELHRDAGFARPNGPRPVAAITNQIARIILLNVKQAALLPRLVEGQSGRFIGGALPCIVHEILLIVDNHKAGASDPPKTWRRGRFPDCRALVHSTEETCDDE